MTIYKRTVDTKSKPSETRWYLDDKEVSYDEWMEAVASSDKDSFQRSEVDGVIINTWTD